MSILIQKTDGGWQLSLQNEAAAYISTPAVSSASTTPSASGREMLYSPQHATEYSFTFTFLYGFISVLLSCPNPITCYCVNNTFCCNHNHQTSCQHQQGIPFCNHPNTTNPPMMPMAHPTNHATVKSAVVLISSRARASVLAFLTIPVIVIFRPPFPVQTVPV